MEASALVHREVYPEMSPKVEYSLTELGYSLKPILEAMETEEITYKKHCRKLTNIVIYSHIFFMGVREA